MHPHFHWIKTSFVGIIDLLAAHGYVYDSSVVPAKIDLYGMPDAQSKPYRISS